MIDDQNTSRTIPNNLPFPSLGDLYKEPEIFCDMVDYYFEHPDTDKPYPPRRVGIFAERGGGKTRSAVEYAWRRADRYTALLFVSPHLVEVSERAGRALRGARP